MDKTIRRGKTEGSITAPPSKSYAQRAVAAALLCDGETVLTNMFLCNDTRAALQVAADLGASISSKGNTYTIRGGLNPKRTSLNIGESGLATRLFTPITALCDQEITLSGTGSILKRPIAMMEGPLNALGARTSSYDGYLPIRICGPMHGGNITVDGSLSSQFITGLLMTLPTVSQDTILTVENLRSRPYIDMTIGLLNEFDIDIQHNDYQQFYIEGDWSGASCLLVAGAVSGEVTIHNLNPLSLQADTAIIDALTRAGAEIITTTDSVTVRKSKLHAFQFDATHCPDLFPALAALAANCEGTSTIRGTHRLTHKESNRAQTIADTFTRMGIQTDIETDDLMQITGGKIRSATVDSYNDHRIAMAAAVSALTCDDRITIGNADAVNKSYPEFWDDLATLSHPI